MARKRLHKGLRPLVTVDGWPQECETASSKCHQVIDQPVHGVALLHRNHVDRQRGDPAEIIVTALDHYSTLATDGLTERAHAADQDQPIDMGAAEQATLLAMLQVIDREGKA